MNYVYLHTNKLNGHCYCGETGQEPQKRWGKGGNEYLQKKNGHYQHPAFALAILKYGWDNFTHEIIYTCESEEEALLFEKEYIETHECEYNCCEGGGKPPVLCGESNPFYRVRPDKAIEKSIASRSGVPLSEEHKRKISEGNKGKPKSNEAAIAKRKKKIICEETGEIFESIEMAAKKVDRNHSCIITAIKKHNRCGGYHFHYLDENSDGYRKDNEGNSPRE